MTIDLQSRSALTRLDAFLLLLAARNSVQFREEEWKWAPTFENAEAIHQQTSKTLHEAMLSVRKETNAAARH